MKYVFVLLALLPFVFCAPSERLILDSFGLDGVIKTIETFAHSGMAHDACVQECHKLVHGFLGSFCDAGCTAALSSV